MPQPITKNDSSSASPSVGVARPNFKTLSDVLREAAQLLYHSADHLKSFVSTAATDARRDQVLHTLAEARTRAGSHLDRYAAAPDSEANQIWIQYGALSEVSRRFHERIEGADSDFTAWQIIRTLDDELVSTLTDMGTTHAPPLEACEKAAAVIMHLKQSSTAIMNTAHDI